MTVAFVLDGQELTARNGGPHFNFNEAISLVVRCRNQEGVDYYWGRLTAGGDPKAQQCGWLKDRFGVSWQVVPDVVPELLTSSDPENTKGDGRDAQDEAGRRRDPASGGVIRGRTSARTPGWRTAP